MLQKQNNLQIINMVRLVEELENTDDKNDTWQVVISEKMKKTLVTKMAKQISIQ